MSSLISLDELLGGGGENSEQKRADEVEKRERMRKERFTQADARMMLTNAAAKLAESEDFVHGQFVRYKAGVENNKRQPCGGVAMFLRHQAPPENMQNREPGLPLSAYEEDCVIGVLLLNGAMAEYYSCSRYLESAPESTTQ